MDSNMGTVASTIVPSFLDLILSNKTDKLYQYGFSDPTLTFAGDWPNWLRRTLRVREIPGSSPGSPIKARVS